MLNRHFDSQKFFGAGPEVHPCAVLDFNGVLDQFTGWTGEVKFTPPAPGALDFVRRLKEELKFKTIIVQTATQPLDGVYAWLIWHGFDKYVDFVTNEKPPAQVYVDDRGVNHNGNFEDTLRAISTLQPHWYNKRPKKNSEVQIKK